jgi:hypothetical protein
MRLRLLAVLAFLLIGTQTGFTQTQSTPQATPRDKTSAQAQDLPPSEEEIDRYKIATNLVTTAVVASNANGLYVADLKKEDLALLEDGTPQEIAFFSSVSAPFHVVLVLDTSASAQEKLRQIQEAAIAFVAQLQGADRVKVISFDDQVRDLNEFTSDKTLLSAAIRRTSPGKNTKLYDAMESAISALYPIKGRRAIVLFSDGVDWHSDTALFDNALRRLDVSGIIVYPIRYDTREETERLAREQSNELPLPTSDVIRGTPPGTTPPTFPGEDPSPARGSKAPEGITRLPPPSVLLGGRRTVNPQSTGRPPGEERLPDVHGRPPSGSGLPGDPTPPMRTRTKPRANDSVSNMLDQLYLMADTYLTELARRSGGRVVRADTLTLLPEAFRNIAAELRTQYMVGYYSTNKDHDGNYRKIQIKTSRKDVTIRAKPGYRAARN